MRLASQPILCGLGSRRVEADVLTPVTACVLLQNLAFTVWAADGEDGLGRVEHVDVHPHALSVLAQVISTNPLSWRSSSGLQLFRF